MSLATAALSHHYVNPNLSLSSWKKRQSMKP